MLAVVALGVVCTALALALFFALIREAGPQRALVITFVNPAVAVLLGVLLLGEPFTLGLALGLPLVLVGCVLATRRSRPGPPSRAPRPMVAAPLPVDPRLASRPWNRGAVRLGDECPGVRRLPRRGVGHAAARGRRPVRAARLEAFQSGLSWITILRKRPAFRAAFAGFAIDAVAAFTADDEARLMADAGIVRNRAKIGAAVRNARAAQELPGGALGAAVVLRPGRGAAPAGHARRRAGDQPGVDRDGQGAEAPRASSSSARPPPTRSCRPPEWSTTTSPRASEPAGSEPARGRCWTWEPRHTGS